MIQELDLRVLLENKDLVRIQKLKAQLPKDLLKRLIAASIRATWIRVMFNSRNNNSTALGRHHVAQVDLYNKLDKDLI